MTFGRVRLSAGFVLLWAVLFFLDDGGWLPLVALAATAHELGHWTVLRAFGRRVRLLNFSVGGITMDMTPWPPIGWGADLVITLAGPMVNILLAGVAYVSGSWQLTGISLSLAAVNLLPAATLDGGRALAIVARQVSGERAERAVATGGTVVCLAALLGGGAWLAIATHGRNLTLLCVGACAVGAWTPQRYSKG